jgi:putative hydrolase of HD superfamily
MAVGGGGTARYTARQEGCVDRIIDFLFEVGMLKDTPRSGWQFLGTGRESVADHVFRATMVAFVLARLDDSVDADRVLRMALVHDLPEARTGDLNYMNQKYVRADEELASRDLCVGLPFGDELDELLREFREESTPESRLVHDADQLELLLQLRAEQDIGNPQAADWIPHVLRRLHTTTARELAESILDRHSADWWFDRDSEWWTRGGKG